MEVGDSVRSHRRRHARVNWLFGNSPTCFPRIARSDLDAQGAQKERPRWRVDRNRCHNQRSPFNIHEQAQLCPGTCGNVDTERLKCHPFQIRRSSRLSKPKDYISAQRHRQAGSRHPNLSELGKSLGCSGEILSNLQFLDRNGRAMR